MRLLNRIFSARVLPSWVILLLDLIIATIAVLLAFTMRYDLSFFPGNEIVIRTVVLVLAVDTLFFRVFHTYSNVLRFSSFVDLMNLFAALALAFLASSVLNLVVLRVSNYTFRLAPIVVLIISYIVSFLLMTTFRLFIKVMYDAINADHKTGINVFIYGTKAGGINIAKSLRMKQDKMFNLCVHRKHRRHVLVENHR